MAVEGLPVHGHRGQAEATAVDRDNLGAGLGAVREVERQPVADADVRRVRQGLVDGDTTLAEPTEAAFAHIQVLHLREFGTRAADALRHRALERLELAGADRHQHLGVQQADGRLHARRSGGPCRRVHGKPGRVRDHVIRCDTRAQLLVGGPGLARVHEDEGRGEGHGEHNRGDCGGEAAGVGTGVGGRELGGRARAAQREAEEPRAQPRHQRTEQRDGEHEEHDDAQSGPGRVVPRGTRGDAGENSTADEGADAQHRTDQAGPQPLHRRLGERLSRLDPGGPPTGHPSGAERGEQSDADGGEERQRGHVQAHGLRDGAAVLQLPEPPVREPDTGQAAEDTGERSDEQ